VLIDPLVFMAVLVACVNWLPVSTGCICQQSARLWVQRLHLNSCNQLRRLPQRRCGRCRPYFQLLVKFTFAGPELEDLLPAELQPASQEQSGLIRQQRTHRHLQLLTPAGLSGWAGSAAHCDRRSVRPLDATAAAGCWLYRRAMRCGPRARTMPNASPSAASRPCRKHHGSMLGGVGSPSGEPQQAKDGVG